MDNGLRIVQGNTFATAIEIHAVDATGQPIVDWSLQDSTDIRVWYVFAGREQDITTWQIDDGKLVILWLANMQRVGTYDIFCAGKYNGADWRNAMQYQFSIVRFNHEANIPANIVILDGIYQLSAELQIITQFQGGGGGGTPSSTLPLMDGEAQVGTETAYARGDHRHPSDTSKQDLIDDLAEIRSGAEAGQTAYQKPINGIPATDLASGVIPDVSQFITKSVNDLVNYYTKNQTYTQAEVNALIAAINQFHYEIAESTSAVVSPASNVLYLIGPTGTGADKYEEYVYTTTWVKIGDTSIDLSGYVTTEALNTALASYCTTTEMQQAISTALASYYTKTEADALLGGKQNTLTFDNVPIEDSNNPVKSGGVYTALGDKEDKTNKVTSLSSSSTDSQYPSAKCVYDGLGGKQDTIDSAHKLDYSLLDNTPTIPAAQVNSDWNAASGVAQILNKPTIPAAGIPAGGNAGQVLTKTDGSTDYAVEWRDTAHIYPSAYCATAAGTAVKGASCTFWTATANSYLHILLKNANTNQGALSLNVNSTGAAPIYINGSVSSSTNYTLPAGSYIVFYDGTNYYFRTDGKLTASITGTAAGTPVVSHGTSDTTFAVTPNTLHVWGEVASLTLTLVTPADSTIVNEYMIQFESGSTATTLSLPSSVEWAESCGALSVEANKTYQISIVNNIGLWAAISNS